MQTLELEFGHSRYPIAIGSGLLGNAALLDSLIPGRDVGLVTDTTVADLYLDRLRQALGSRRVVTCVLPAGERHKNLQAVERLFDAWVDGKLNRDATVIALGGGVVGDIAGFAAASYQRGVDYIQVPTTLLAQVDSSVGGKTGVNHSGGKNLIGAFHQPKAVIADMEVLYTLPPRELRAGLAEVIKYGCICDEPLFDWLEDHVDELTVLDPGALVYAVKRCCELKAAVVMRDERESGERAILNFGHTFGHAIEAATHYETFLHGEAVGLGMLVATALSQRCGLIGGEVAPRLRTLLGRAKLPLEVPRIGAARALELMRMDKKVAAGAIRLVLLSALGRGIFTADYARDALDATLTEYFE